MDQRAPLPSNVTTLPIGNVRLALELLAKAIDASPHKGKSALKGLLAGLADDPKDESIVEMLVIALDPRISKRRSGSGARAQIYQFVRCG